LPGKYFADKIDRSRKIRPELCLIVLREVVDPVLARSSDPERAELFVTRINKKDDEGKDSWHEIIRARVNGEKFVSAERLTGLRMCRILNQNDGNNWNIISSDYSYNEIFGGLQTAINPDTVTYGAVGTEDETFAIKSRVIEGYTYTIEPYNLLNKEQHNAMYETGTMMKVGAENANEEERGRGLYTHVNIEPPAKMIHFVRIDAPTKEMLLYVLHNILNTTTYFARSSRKGIIRNRVLGIIFSKTAIGLSSGELIKELFSSKIQSEYTDEEVFSAVKTYVNNHKNVFWKIIWDDKDEEFKNLMSPVIDVALLTNENDKKVLKECLVELTRQGKSAYVPPIEQNRSGGS
jgi:CRISPR-associated protein Csc2